MTLGQSICKHRAAVGMTIGWLAGQCRVCSNTVSNWERDRTEPSANQLIVIALTVGCTVQDLLTGENAEPVITSQRFCPGA